MKFWKKKKVIKRGPKPSVSYLNPWSKVFFFGALAGLIFGATELLGLTEYEYSNNNSSGVSGEVSQQSNTPNAAEEEFVVYQASEEQLLEQINTIAYVDAIWPGYKGDKLDGVAVRKHFHENLAKVVINNAKGYEIFKEYVIHFYYAVRADGAIQYYAIVRGGRTSEDLPKHLVKITSQTMSIGIPGIKPGENSKGDPITVVHEMIIRFKPGF